MMLLLQLFYPQAISTALSGNADPAVSSYSLIIQTVSAVCSIVLQPANLVTVRFWIFIYLVLCVGGHMAPSWSDYRGAGRGAILLGSLAFVAIVILAIFAGNTTEFQSGVVSFFSPLFALFAITILLVLVATLFVVLVLGYFPRRYVVR